MSKQKGKRERSSNQRGPQSQSQNNQRTRGPIFTKIIGIAALIILVFFIIGLLIGGKDGDGEQTSGSASPTPTQPAVTDITMSVVGDIMLHSPQNNDAYDEATGTYDYSGELKYVKDYLLSADLTVGNFETTMAGGPNYTGYPTFNSPEIIATNLKDAGFDLVSTANNHCMDKGVKGLKSTISNLDAAGIDHVGTYAGQESRDENHGIVVKDVDGIKIAFLSYTYGTNGIPVPDGYEYAVNLIYQDYLTDFSVVNEQLIKSDLDAAKAMDVDLICVFTHWGYEYHTTQSDAQEQFADFLFENGADIILGGHPHVLQPFEKRTVTTADGEQKEVFVVYSLGNFISSQNAEYTDTSVILNIDISKDLNTGKTTIGDITYIPVYMLDRELGADERYVLLDVRAAMADYESGSTGIVTKAQYQKLVKALDDIHDILGEQCDIINKEQTPAAA